MGSQHESGFFSHGEKRQMQEATLLVAGIFIFIIGVSVGSLWVWALGAVCFITGGVGVYKRFKTRSNMKRIAAEEAEIRAHQLRQARGEAAN